MAYKTAVFLGSPTGPDTSSAVCFEEDGLRFVEITGDAGSVRLTQAPEETNSDYICRLLSLENQISNFKNHLLSIKDKLTVINKRGS